MLERVGDVWVDVQAFDACPACGVDWRPADVYLRSWLPCRCARPAETGHRVYTCKTCRATSYDPPHDDGGSLAAYPPRLNAQKDARPTP